MEERTRKETEKEYNNFILWRCKGIREDCTERAIQEGIELNSKEFIMLLARESYKKGLSDLIKMRKYII